MDKEQIQICQHLARAYRHVMKAQEIIIKHGWDDLNICEITEPLSKELVNWVDDSGDDALEIKEDSK